MRRLTLERRGRVRLSCFLLLPPFLLCSCSRLTGLDDFSLAPYEGGTGGSSGYEPPACSGDPVADPNLVRDDCGTFVSASAGPGGNGTKAAPFSSFAEAATRGATRIYACAESYPEAEAVRFSGGVQIYAGFTECGAGGAWRWAEGSRATLSGPADQVALTLDGGDNLLRNLNVTVADATTPDASSIAVVASGGSLTVTNGDLTAGAAMEGEAGESLAADPMLDGEDGDPGVGVCGSGANNPGPMGKTKVCPSGEESTSGNGGDGGELMGTTLLAAGSGTDGTPPDPAQPTRGKGGRGEGTGTPAAPACDIGSTGADGAIGDSGAGADGVGTLSIDGFSGVNGMPGTDGLPGQGGGGGGGAKGGLTITCSGGGTANRVGGSGGAGGTGGCGGTGGGAGRAGGSSIALVALETALTFTTVTLTAGRAGDGGNGGDGQTGGNRGLRGNGGPGVGLAKPSCDGGDGGRGGDGGPGGGGQGGHSLGIALQGGTAPAGGTFAIDSMNAGTGGLGGANSTASNAGQGASGIAAACWNFDTNTPCGG